MPDTTPNLHDQIKALKPFQLLGRVDRFQDAINKAASVGFADCQAAAAELAQAHDSEMARLRELNAKLLEAAKYGRHAIRTGKFSASNVAQMDEIIDLATAPQPDSVTH